MKRFEIGKTYSMHFVTDHDLVVNYTVTARTEKTITITDGKKEQTCRINKAVTDIRNTESVYPLGRYSMAPILSA